MFVLDHALHLADYYSFYLQLAYDRGHFGLRNFLGTALSVVCVQVDLYHVLFVVFAFLGLLVLVDILPQSNLVVGRLFHIHY